MDDDLRRSATAGEHGVGGKGAGALGEHGPGHLVRPLDLPGGLCGGRAVMISRRGCSGRRSWERREGSGREDEERIRHDLTARLQWRRSRERGAVVVKKQGKERRRQRMGGSGKDYA